MEATPAPCGWPLHQACPSLPQQSLVRPREAATAPGASGELREVSRSCVARSRPCGPARILRIHAALHDKRIGRKSGEMARISGSTSSMLALGTRANLPIPG